MIKKIPPTRSIKADKNTKTPGRIDLLHLHIPFLVGIRHFEHISSIAEYISPVSMFFLTTLVLNVFFTC